MQPPTPPDPERLDALGIRLLNAMLDAADPDVIGVKNWWDRAQAALQTGASAAVDFPAMVSTMARKLTITWALPKEVAAEVGRLRGELADPVLMAAFRDHCRSNAVYVTALARLERDRRREARRATRAEQDTII